MARSLKMFIVIVALVVATPAGSAQAAGPTRTVSEAEGFVIPAGAACAFAVSIEPADGPITTVVSELSDGRVVATIRQGFIRMTNLETGDSLVHHSQYRGMTTYDAVADQYLATTDGTA